MAKKLPDPPLQVNFRMPASIKDKLQVAADASGRSLTAEIIKRLGESFTRDKTVIDLIEDQRQEREFYQSLLAGLLDAAGDRVPKRMRDMLHPLRPARDDATQYYNNLLGKFEAMSDEDWAGKPEDRDP